MELKGKIIHFLGDSITEGVGVSHPDAIYHARIKQMCGLAQANNFGISATRFARQRTPSIEPSYDRDFISRVGDLPLGADAVVVFGGTNDFGHGDAILGCMEDDSPYTFYGACHQLFTSLLRRFPTIPIIIVTPLHRQNENVPALKTSADGTHVDTPVLKTYVDIIKEVAAYYSLPVCDLYAYGGMYPELAEQREALCPDGLHPNDAGHWILARKLASFLQTV